MGAMLNPRVPQLDPLEIRRKPLSIRSLNPRRPPADVMARIRGEFVEMRGFCPTVEQAARLFDLPRDECTALLAALVQQRFLHLSADGRYRLLAQG